MAAYKNVIMVSTVKHLKNKYMCGAPLKCLNKRSYNVDCIVVLRVVNLCYHRVRLVLFILV